MKSEKKTSKLKEQKAITLIALVITIVVMLILAGVTINLTLGENGIFTTAQQAAKNYTETQEKEMAELGDFTNTVNNIIEGKKTLTSQITGADYGKYIDYSVTVKGTTLDKWRVFYNDTTTGNVYIIFDGYLPNTLIPEETGIQTTGTYQVYWSTDDFSTNVEAVETLTNKDKWKVFAEGVKGASATGAPTYEMFANSWNENPIVNSRILTAGTYTTGLTDISKLYIPYTEIVENCYGYFLARIWGLADHIWFVNCNGLIDGVSMQLKYYSIRPLVCLPSSITGTVGSTVNIDK